jgi:hypothetical protein
MTRVDHKSNSIADTAVIAGTSQILAINGSPPVTEFIRRNDIVTLLNKAVTLVCELFPKLHAVMVEASSDPEESSEWIVLRVTSAAPRGEMNSAYRRYIHRWVRETPPDKRHLVRLSYTNV